MIIKNKNNGLLVHPKFDSGEYMGSFTITHNELKYLDCEDPKWDVCSLLISTYVGSYLDETLNKLTEPQSFIPEQKGNYTDADALSMLENEGIVYAVTCHTDASQFKNAETRRLWYNAEKALQELQKHLGYE